MVLHKLFTKPPTNSPGIGNRRGGPAGLRWPHPGPGPSPAGPPGGLGGNISLILSLVQPPQKMARQRVDGGKY